jgi:hypothetical protein
MISQINRILHGVAILLITSLGLLVILRQDGVARPSTNVGSCSASQLPSPGLPKGYDEPRLSYAS